MPSKSKKPVKQPQPQQPRSIIPFGDLYGDGPLESPYGNKSNQPRPKSTYDMPTPKSEKIEDMQKKLGLEQRLQSQLEKQNKVPTKRPAIREVPVESTQPVAQQSMPMKYVVDVDSAPQNLKPFLRMLKAGVPVGAVTQKMNEKNLQFDMLKKYLQVDTSAFISKSKFKNVLARYGVPEDTINAVVNELFEISSSFGAKRRRKQRRNCVTICDDDDEWPYLQPNWQDAYFPYQTYPLQQQLNWQDAYVRPVYPILDFNDPRIWFPQLQQPQQQQLQQPEQPQQQLQQFGRKYQKSKKQVGYCVKKGRIVKVYKFKNLTGKRYSNKRKVTSKVYKTKSQAQKHNHNKKLYGQKKFERNLKQRFPRCKQRTKLNCEDHPQCTWLKRSNKCRKLKRIVRHGPINMPH